MYTWHRFAVGSILLVIPGLVSGQTRTPQNSSRRVRQNGTTRTSASPRSASPRSVPAFKQEALDSAETYTWNLNFKMLHYRNGALWGLISGDNGIAQDTVVYQYPDGVPTLEQEGYQGPTPSPFVMDNGIVVIFTTIPHGYHKQANGLGRLRLPLGDSPVPTDPFDTTPEKGFFLMALTPPTTPHRMYFEARDIWDPTAFRTFFEDKVLFRDNTPMIIYASNYFRVLEDYEAPDKNINLPRDRSEAWKKLRLTVADALNQVVYNRAIDLFTHPTIAQLLVFPQIVHLYKFIKTHEQDVHAPTKREAFLKAKRMLNRELLNYFIGGGLAPAGSDNSLRALAVREWRRETGRDELPLLWKYQISEDVVRAGQGTAMYSRSGTEHSIPSGGAANQLVLYGSKDEVLSVLDPGTGKPVENR